MHPYAFTIDHQEAEENEIICPLCDHRFKGGEKAVMVKDETPTGQHAECHNHPKHLYRFPVKGFKP
jgi:hypothetical protein